MADAEPSAAIALLSAESAKRGKEKGPAREGRALEEEQEGSAMPEMQGPPHARRKEEGRSQVLQVPEMRTALFGRLEHVASPSKLTPSKIRAILALIALDCPGWVIADVNPKTAQFWFDRCLDAATEWSMGSKLSINSNPNL